MNKDQALDKLLSLEHHINEDNKALSLEIIKELKQFFDSKPRQSADFEWLKIFVTKKQRSKPNSYAPRCNFIIPIQEGLMSTNNKILLLLKNARPEGAVYDLIQDIWLDEQEYASLNYSGAERIDNLLLPYKEIMDKAQTPVSITFEAVQIDDKKLYRIVIDDNEFFYNYTNIKKVLSGFKTYDAFIHAQGVLKLDSADKMAVDNGCPLTK